MVNNTVGCAGIDTGKDRLDVSVHGTGETVQVVNTKLGHRELAVWLGKRRIKRVGIEATGGYEAEVVRTLRAKGFEVVIFQPKQVRAYAQYRLRRAKNDKIDAALIAHCTAAVETVPPAPDDRLVALAEDLTFVEQIEEDIARLKTRIEGHRDGRIRRAIGRQIEGLRDLRKSELKRLADALEAEADLNVRLKLILSVPGIGLRTALAILIRLPEIGTLSREQTSSLAGLAPFDADSGRHNGQRHIAGGRSRLRRALFAAAMPASFHWNPNLVATYKRLTAAGKAHKVALIACARKLLIYANTVVARGTPWSDGAPA